MSQPMGLVTVPCRARAAVFRRLGGSARRCRGQSVGQAVNVGEPDQVGSFGQADQGADQFEQPDLGSALGNVGPGQAGVREADVSNIGSRSRTSRTGWEEGGRGLPGVF